MQRPFYFKAFLFVCLLLAALALHSEVPQATADSIARILNKSPEVCDPSCSLYAQEHTGASMTNTIFISLLLILGSIWLYITYKKKYIIILGSVLGGLVLGSYFAQPLFRSNKVPANCPIIQKQGVPSHSPDSFIAPGSEFSQDSIAAKDSASAVSSDEFSQASGDEFSSASGGEFSQANSEFQAADPKSGNDIAPKAPVRKINYTMIYEPVIIFLILGLIGLMIRYPWFRKLRGLFLLAGLLYLGFYRGACPCMISSFQNTALLIFGIKVHWESLLWFLLLIPATYLFGKVWCGWLCHLGALQEFLFRAPKLKLLTNLKAQKVLKVIQISVLSLWILQLLITRTNIFCEIDPFKVAFNLFSANWIGYALLGVLLISSVLIYKPFCRTMCPVGLTLGWVSLIPGARRLNKNDLCIDCFSCHNECNQRAMIHENRKTVLHNQDCIMCGECFHTCKKDALKVHRHNPRLRILPVLLAMLAFSSLAKAQWECPSRLGGSLKPFGQSNLMWAGEAITTGGFIGNEGLTNAMLFGGLDYSVNNHTLYVEGGFKSWYRLGGDRSDNGLYSLGLREAFYRNTGNKHTLTVGLHSAKSDDYYLLNERIVGANYRVSLGKVELNAIGGSVMKDFARNGTFCTLSYLYNIIPGRQRAILGSDFGQTNLSMLTLTYKPSQRRKKPKDEFALDGQLVASDQHSLLSLNSAGAVLYKEFGNWTPYKTLLSGLFLDVNLAGISLKPEVLWQSGKGNNALIYSIMADKQFAWSNGQLTKLFARYVGMTKSDSTAVATNSFSNIFAGEVLRLDALEMPFLQVGLKHSFPSLKASIKLQAAMQTGNVSGYTMSDNGTATTRMQETDLTFSKNLGKLFLVNASLGYVKYPSLTTDPNLGLMYKAKSSPWGKIELRITF